MWKSKCKTVIIITDTNGREPEIWRAQISKNREAEDI